MLTASARSPNGASQKRGSVHEDPVGRGTRAVSAVAAAAAQTTPAAVTAGVWKQPSLPRRARRPTSRATDTATRLPPSLSSASSPSHTVVEIWPGGGWYTEILAPYLTAGGGKLYAAAPDWGRERHRQAQGGQRRRFTAPSRSPISRPSTARHAEVPAGTADVVAHLPQRPQLADGLPPRRQAGLQRRGLPPDLRDAQARRHARHRGPPPARKRRRRARAASGYIKVSTVRRLAEAAGFRFAGVERDQRQPARTRPTGRTASGRSRPRSASATRTARNMSRSAKATA